MEELHQQEQFFYEPNTIKHLSSFLFSFDKICCVCTPLLGKALVEAGKEVVILDIDSRFEMLPGFRFYNLYQPQSLEEHFDILICDPPFQKVTLSQLFSALRILSHHNFAQPLMLSHLKEREYDILGTFSPFQLRRTQYYPRYISLKKYQTNTSSFTAIFPKLN